MPDTVSVPLSFGQQRLWVLQRLFPNSPEYHLSLALNLSGELNVEVLKRAINWVAARHEPLRATFHDSPNGPVQRIHPPGPVALPVRDLASIPTERRLDAIHQEAAPLIAASFDLSVAHPWRLCLLRFSSQSHTLVACVHHLIADGWSFGVWMRELGEAYEAFAAGREPQLPPLTTNYRVYIERQASALDGDAREKHLAYWKRQLDGITPLQLPNDVSAKSGEFSRGATASFVIEPVLFSAVQDMARATGVTPFAILFSVYALLLARYSGQDDLVIGIPTAGRNTAEFEQLIGFFVDSLPLRISLGDQPTLRELARRVLRTLGEALLHQALPFEEIVRTVTQDRSLATTPVFQVMMAYQNVPLAPLRIPGLEVTPLHLESGAASFDLTLVLEEEGNALQARWEYNADHFSREAISRLSRHFLRLLNLVIEQPDTPLDELPLLTAEEKAQLHVWNDTARPYPQERCLHEWIADQAARTPDAPAVLFETQSLTYRELDERANRLAHFLREHGVGPEVRVGLCLERSLELMVGLLGVLKAGGAYVPLDPSYPRERLAYMLADSGCRIVLTQAHLCEQLTEWADTELVCLDSEWPVIAACSPAPLHSGVSPQNAINVIFTSGSTGKPKGVVNTHRGLVNRLFWMQETYQLGSSDRVLQKTPISFDVAGWEFFWPLLCGATQVMARPEGHKDPQYLVDTIKRYAVTTLHFVPSMLQAFLLSERVEECTSLRRVICSGEALTPAHQQAFFARLGAELYNLYGPTEAAIDVSFWRCHPDSPYDAVPIGRPVANTRLYILDERLQPVPVGVSGELYIGGVQVARGYLNRPDLTAERFIPNPLPAASGERLYRTGDLARFLADGSIEYLGRIDHQVKVRGCRIELGEIEDALRKHAEVRDAVVVAREFGPGDLRLVAYLVMAGGKRQPVSAWREHLGQTLPDYMLPSAYVYLEALPLSPNGKLDRKALPAPENAHTESIAYVPPRTPAEKMLASIWQELLGITRVGLFDHFFHLGGHSLLAARLVSHVAARFGQEIPLRLVFEHPTLEAMAAQLAGTGNDTGRSASAPMLPRERNDQPLPLSFTQERLWFLDRLLPQSAMYNIPMVLHLQGPLDVGAMERALSLLVARHEALRTTIHETGGNPYQVVAAAAPVSLPLIDLSAEAPAEREEAKHRLELTEASAPFTLSEGPLWRTKLVRLAPEDHLILWTMHHIITDGWSLSVLGEDLARAYNDFVAGRTADLPAMPLQYADYAFWQREQYRADRIAEPLAYWRKQLAGLETLQLPTDYPRPAVSGHRGAREPVCIPEALCRRLREMCLALDVTPFMAMLAVFQTLLSRWSGQDDIAVGSPVGNRSHVETERVVGFFANTLVLRGDLSGSPSFRSLLTRVREMCLEAYAHQDVPFEMLVSDLKPLRDLSQNPLFQVMFVLQNATTREFGFQRVRVVPELPPVTVAKFDLTLDLAEADGAIKGVLEYSADLFTPATARRLTEHFLRLLNLVIEQPDTPLEELPLLTAEEKAQLHVWNDTARPYPRERCLHEWIADQAARTPDAPAVLFEAQSLTYRELDARANRLAHFLREHGVGPEVRVGLCLERSLELMVGLLGVLKAGGAYVPLDPSYPRERLAFMLADSGCRIVLTQAHLCEPLTEWADAELICLDSEWPVIAACSPAPLHSGVSPQNAINVIFTSGSTGKPKGVVNTHRGLVNRLFWMQETYQLGSSDRVLQKTPISFDVAGWEFFWPLLCGATQVMAWPEGHKDPQYLVDTIKRYAVTTLHFVPSMLQAFLLSERVEECTSLRRVICSGEALTPAHQQAFFARLGAELYNLYGPTEAAIDVSFWRCHPDSPHDAVPIGRPVANTRLYILDGRLQPVPVGVSGELYIGGVQVARGYLNRPDLTAERFIPNPLPAAPGERLYRTGDLARFLADGSIEYLGRIDHQVKVRGCRIELGEIEDALRKHADVRDAVVVAREFGPGDLRLVAYLVMAGGTQQPVSAWREHLGQTLPDYMLPSAYVYLEALPLSPNGKLDRKTLPAPENAHTESVAYVPPRTPAEESLCAIIADVLNLAKVGGNDNFFALGGDSILAIQVVSRARSAGLQLTPHDLFRAQTVAELALCAVEQVSQEEADAEEEGGIVPLTPIQRWFFTTQPVERHHFNQSVLLRPAGVIDPEAIRWALQELVSRHAALRLCFSADGQEQSVAPFAEVPLDVINLRNASEIEWLRAVEEYCGKLQGCLDIAAGPLTRACYFEGPDHAGNRLFLVCHHLAVDSVSWRILVDDLERLLRARSCGKEPELVPVTVSFPRWARGLCALADSPDTLAEAEFWEQQLGASLALSLPGGMDAGAPFDASGFLNEEETERLLHGIHESFHTGVQDVLVAALALTLARLDGLQEHSVMLESHGRGALDAYDLAHTVGWLTSLYPLRLTLPKGEDILALVKETKERLRRVPRQGIGYGLLRFVSEDARALALRSLPAAPVCFNYLGQITTEDASLFTLAAEPVGLSTSPSRRPPYALEWNGAIRGGCLHFVVSCDPLRVTPDAACRFARAYEGAVREILTCCESDAVGGYTPSDFTLANLDQDELDDLLSDINDDD